MAKKFEPVPLTIPFPPALSETPPPEGLYLHIENPCVADLPEEGEITFRYRRGPVTTVEETKTSEERTHADFNLLEITCCKEGKSGEKEDRVEDKLDELFQEANEKEED